jgi:hypothetical protein
LAAEQGAESCNGEITRTHVLPDPQVEAGQHRKSLVDAPINAAPLVSPLLTEVVRYLRQQDDVVVHEGDGKFLVNGRFRFEISELIAKANSMRRRQNRPLFY